MSGNGREEEEEMEMEIEEMAHKIEVLRSNTPLQIGSALTSLLAAKRPLLPLSDAEIGGEESDASDELTVDKTVSVKSMISRNISAISLLSERMHKCIAALDTLESHKRLIPSVFTNKTTN